MAEYKGKTVTLNRPRAISKGSPGYGKKRKEVFVKGCSSESSRVKRITFGDAKLGMHKNTKSRKKSYCARSGGMSGTTDRCSANYWARRDWDCPSGKAWAKRTFDTYPSAYANMAASKYCKDPNYAKKSKRTKKAKGGPVIRGQGIVMKARLR